MMPRRHGFTLIELLIAIAIIGILASIAIRSFWAAKDRGLESSVQADLRQAAAEQELYFDEFLTYASAVSDLTDLRLSPGVVLNITYAQPDGWAGVAKHTSLPATMRCGLAIGDAPLDGDNPATSRGRIMCAKD
jgi:prepilin-type N-terminal cleavage/methylation domain-containing protein